jgi:hypothetical protein
VDVNDAFDSILLNVFEEYPKVKDEKSPLTQQKKGHKFKSKKKK